MHKAGVVLDYHQATKHYPQQYARSLGFLDWRNQPEAFLRYGGSPLYWLPLDQEAPPECGFDALHLPGAISPAAFTAQTFSRWLALSLGLAIWREHQGVQWALRCTPSSGNLHPTEAHLITGPLPELDLGAGLYHYAVREHGLEKRRAFSPELWRGLSAQFGSPAALITLASIHWRTIWKYGERAYRYCQQDIGHALAALAYAAAAQGWTLRRLHTLEDSTIEDLFALRENERTPLERQWPGPLLALYPTPPPQETPANPLPPSLLHAIKETPITGAPDALSLYHQEWPRIEDVAEAALYTSASGAPPACDSPTTPPAPPALDAWRLFKQRRSALLMDGERRLPRSSFFQMLHRLMPTTTTPPWQVNLGEALVHPVFLLHRVSGLAPGLYILVRNPVDEAALRANLGDDFSWEAPPACPQSLPFYLLESGDKRDLAIQLCCNQTNAGLGVFCAIMLGRFKQPLFEEGPWRYRNALWEAGLLGQALYLEAEACNLRGLGIGCYYDDLTHQVLGIRGKAYQSLYHFSVGGAVEDDAILSKAPFSEARRTSLGRAPD